MALHQLAGGRGAQHGGLASQPEKDLSRPGHQIKTGVEHFTRSCNCLSPFLETRFISEPPIRGPKSAPAPYRHEATPDSSRCGGVRVSPLSARGEGLCRAQPRFLQRPGKQTEGIHIQLGNFSYPRSTFDFPYPTKGPAQPAPWGRRFRLWRFRYKIVRRKLRKSRGSRTVKDDKILQHHRGTASNLQADVGRVEPGHPAARRGACVRKDRPRCTGLLALLLGCLPVQGAGVTPGLPGETNPRHIRAGKRAWTRAQRQVNQQGHTWYRSSKPPGWGSTHRPYQTLTAHGHSQRSHRQIKDHDSQRRPHVSIPVGGAQSTSWVRYMRL